ncbi:multidrug effflux MFS transporter [Acidocella sp. KAb 2-4]|uniref:multidrug effflux MFS transporter n=1 Tax=Acidocella sp. KAb 2-4 TaxID=2885158 RepID=UPI001D0676F4|nr:multidrug effflux MFS transporter [Acidocella sp. KAb 2-4]
MKNPHSLIFLIFLAALAALPPFSIDMALPALREIGTSLNTAPGMTGLTLSLFMAGFATTPVVYGPLSDRFGRRPVLAVALALFTLGSLAASAAPSIMGLLTARFIEGAGAGGGTALAFALVRDCFEGAAGRAKLSQIQTVMGVAPMIAPSIGAFLLIAGWRSIYATLALGGLVLLAAIWLGLEETHKSPNRQGSLFGQVLHGYGLLFSHRAALGYALVFGVSFGVQFSFISGSSLVFIGHYGLSARVYGLVFAAASAGIMLGALSNPMLSRLGVGHGAALRAGLGLYLATGLGMVALLATGTAGAWNLTALLVLSAYGYGLTAPNASHGTMQALPEIAGVAAAVLTTLQMSVAVLASVIVAASFTRFGVAAMVVPMLGFGLLTNALYFFLVRPAHAHV